MISRTDVQQQEVVIHTAGGAELPGFLTLPKSPQGLVIFAHGSGSSRFSSRNRYVADVLREGELATLLFDLLTAEEHQVDERTRHLRFDIPLLAERLTDTVNWASEHKPTHALPVGLFGASTGAAAALITAADRPDLVGAAVSRGGRPDLAGSALSRVAAPVLLIVGSRDTQVIELNRQAAELLRVEHRLELVEGATHLFEEPGTLEKVAQLAKDWFTRHLGGGA